MTREEILDEVLNIKANNILLELATGAGKSKVSLELVNKYIKKTPKKDRHILIVYPKNLLTTDWLEEINKWGMKDLLPYITFTNYASLHKHAVDDKGKVINYTAIIFDECHHLSDLKRELVKGYTSKHNILLSATVNKNLKQDLFELFEGLIEYKLPVKTAIEEEILPSPTVLLVPLSLSSIKEKQYWIINPKAKLALNKEFPLNRNSYWSVRKKGYTGTRYALSGTAVEYNLLMNQLIDFYKIKARCSNIMKKIHIRMCGDRLKWYADIKTNAVKEVLKVLKDYKTLTFCTSIEQANQLSKYAIHSKNKKAIDVKQMFNEGKIKHITAVDCLTEGANLADCKFGIWARYNTSETKIPQKIGRILRHKSPYMILPYFKGTVEEDIVKKMLEAISAERVVTIKSPLDIKKEISD